MTTNYITPDDLHTVLQLLTPGNRIVCELAIATGLRISDVLGIRTADLAQRMTIREAKTGKRRRIYIPVDLLTRIANQAGNPWAFPGRDPAKHRSRQAVWADIKRAAKACRLDANAGPHSLRKVYAVDLMRKYGDVAKVQAALGHDRLETTMLYAMADLMAQRRPPKTRRRKD
jgi:integrase